MGNRKGTATKALSLFAVLIMVAAALALYSRVAPPPTAGASTFTLPSVAFTTGTIPATFISPETPITCLSRADQAGSTATVYLLCYSTPWPAEDPIISTIFTANVNQSTGLATLPVLPCTVVVPGFLSLSLNGTLSLSKGGGEATGSTALVLDTSTPFDCGETAQFGSLTMTPRAIGDDWDGDGCTDYDELGGSTDPFNPNDCGPAPEGDVFTSGVYDILVGNLQGGLFYCIAKAELAGNNDVTSTHRHSGRRHCADDQHAADLGGHVCRTGRQESARMRRGPVEPGSLG